MVRIALAFLVLLLAAPASAHDSWINRGGFKSPTSGELCCGEGDCFVIPSESVALTRGGYSLFGKELVPFSEAIPSPDGQFWRCKRPDGSRRCFFAPPPNS